MSKKSRGEISMLKKKSRFSIYFFMFFIVLAVLGTWHFALNKGNVVHYNTVNAHKGILTVSDSVFSENKLIYLEGEYEFYWNQYLYPSDFDSLRVTEKPQFVDVPSVWNDYLPNSLGMGYATYRLIIKVPTDDWYGFKIKEIDCAYRLWANSEMVSAGNPGVNKETTTHSWKRREVFCYSKDRTIELVMHIANFSHRKGGPEDVLIMGRGEDVLRFKMVQFGISLFLLGGLIILSIYFGGLYIFGRNEPSVSYFSLVCLFMALRLLTTGEKVLLEIFPTLNWEIALRIEYVVYTVMVPLFLYFMNSFYPHIFHRKIINSVKWCAVVFLLILFLPPHLFSYSPLFYQAIIFFVGSYIMWGLFQALKGKEEFSFIFSMGYLFFFVILINDILFYNKLINSAFLMPFGMFVLVFSYTFAMSQKMTFAYIDVELLTMALNKQNLKLEKRVKKRTHQVMEQRNEMQRQKEELEIVNGKLISLDQYKQDMTSMIVHDLKNPLNSIINLSQMDDVPDKDQMITHSGKEMLNMVLNILDLNRSEEAEMQLNISQALFSELYNSVLVDVNLILIKRAIFLECEYVNDYVLSCDVDLVKRVLVNILTNAIRYSPVGGLILIHTQVLDDGWLTVLIKDQGPGVQSDKKDIIFNRYQFFDPGDNGMKSTGLGLAFCKLAIEAHGGAVGISEDRDKGAEFYFSIPLIEVVPLGKKTVVLDEIISEGEQPLEENSKDLERIIHILDDLENLEIYEISAINIHFRSLMKVKVVGVVDWIKKMEIAVSAYDSDKFKKLIQRMKSHYTIK